MAIFDTVANIIADVGAELGLGTLTAAYPSTDATVSQMQALLKAVGRGLVLESPWLQQRTDYQFDANGQTIYALPAGFERMVDQSGWNRTRRQPLVPLSPQAWEAMKATGVTGTMPIFFRTYVDEPATGITKIEFLSNQTTDDEIFLEYWSRLWVRPTGVGPVYLDAPAATTDTLRIDVHLVTRALKLAWLRAKGFESTAAQQDFEETLEAVRSANVVTAPTLSLNGPQGFADRLLSSANIPDTGYGA